MLPDDFSLREGWPIYQEAGGGRGREPGGKSESPAENDGGPKPWLMILEEVKRRPGPPRHHLFHPARVSRRFRAPVQEAAERLEVPRRRVFPWPITLTPEPESFMDETTHMGRRGGLPVPASSTSVIQPALL